MNLFETNRLLAVKLNQSFQSLYELPAYEYLTYVKLELSTSGGEVQETFEIQPGLND